MWQRPPMAALPMRYVAACKVLDARLAALC